MKTIHAFRKTMNSHAPLLLAVVATVWTAFALVWTLHAAFYPLG